MDLSVLLFLLFSFAVWASFALRSNSRPRNPSKLPLPPGPKPFPIIGNILELGPNPHHSLTKLSKTYGPLISLKLGTLTTVVASSPETARAVLQQYDHLCSNRSVPAAVHALDHHKFGLAPSPVNDRWRRLRKICKEQMFSVSRLDSSQELRREKLHQLMDYVQECSITGRALDIGREAFTTSLNLIFASLFSVDFAVLYGSDSSQEIKDMVWKNTEASGKPNLADYFPFLRPVDPQGLLRRKTLIYKKFFEIFDGIIGQRLQSRRASGGPMSKNDMLEALLDLNQKNESELSFNEINHLLLDLFIAGTDTSSTTIEWVMTELMSNPEKMVKVRNELLNVVGQNERVQEADISRIPYLQAVIKETFRLHPVVPFLLPHKATEDIEINGRVIPQNAQVLVNVYAIGRDANLWPEPDRFVPERFLEQEINYHGRHFELIPFGSGRRICPGLPLAHRMVHLVIASLIHNFDWKLEGEIQPGQIDMSEKFGLTLQKATPLKIIPLKLK
uniref:Cytochrome P450 n=1 Tax=Scoparia dulcis TaxID=107240 RepID=A0A1W7HBV2_SCODU